MIKKVDLIAIGQQSRLLFLPVTDTIGLRFEAILYQSKWRVAILNPNACGPSLFSLSLSLSPLSLVKNKCFRLDVIKRRVIVHNCTRDEHDTIQTASSATIIWA